MTRNSPALAHQFETMEQQREAVTLGMWIFLATEVLFFGVLFMSYTYGRWAHPEAWAAASHRTDAVLGGINTGVLLVSSFFMAVAVNAAKLGQRKLLTGMLSLTALLGIAFLGIKAFEYYKDWREHLVPGAGFEFEGPHRQGAELFFYIYFAMTGLHAIHVTIGIVIMLVLAVMSWRGRFSEGHYMPVDVTGLYWHFVDIIWVFLFPLLYLVGHR